MQIERIPLAGFAALEQEWRSLEAAAPELSFFQSWTWVGCLAEERYTDPVLLRASQAGRVLGLALFNRRGKHWHLAESGDPAMDAPFVEHNAPLVADRAASLPLLRAVWGLGATRLVLSGTAPALAAECGGTVLRLQERLAPRVDLRLGGGGWMAGRSANTRQQLRRSARAYGMPVLHRAADLEEAQRWLVALVALHTASWNARGKPGAFATPWLRRFHAALVARAFERGELELLRAGGEGATLGYLYNFRLRGQNSAYQSGFAPPPAGAQHKPGLTCHALAIEAAEARGDAVYDFLAGDDRYKRSLANAELPLHWVQRVPRWSAWGIAARLRSRLRRG